MRDGNDVGVEVKAIAERRRERGGETVVAALDAVHRAGQWAVVVGGELIDQRDERELVGIGQKESAKACRGRPQLCVGFRTVEP